MGKKVLAHIVPTPERCQKLWCRSQAVEVVVEDHKTTATCRRGHTWLCESYRFERSNIEATPQEIAELSKRVF